MPAIIERNVNPAQVGVPAGRSMQAFRRDAEYLAENESALLAKFPGEWIAVFDTKVVAHAPQKRAVGKQLRQKGLSHLSPVIRFLDAEPPTLFL